MVGTKVKQTSSEILDKYESGNTDNSVSGESSSSILDRYSNQLYSPPEPELPKSESGEFVKSVKSATDSLQATGGGLLSLVGESVSEFAPDVGGKIQEYGNEVYEKNIKEAEENQGRVTDFSQIGNTDESTLSDIIDFGLYGAGQLAPSLIGGVGLGSVASFAGKKLVQSQIKKRVKKKFEDKLKANADKVVKESLEDAQQKALLSEAGQKALSRGATIGSIVGGGGFSVGTQTGEIFGDIKDIEPVEGEDPNKKTLAILGGLVGGALDFATPFSVLNKIGFGGKWLGKVRSELAKKGRLSQAAKEIALTGATEGTTEALQEGIGSLTRNFVKENKIELTDEDLHNMANAGVLGAIGGGLVGGATGSIQGEQKQTDFTDDELAGAEEVRQGFIAQVEELRQDPERADEADILQARVESMPIEELVATFNQKTDISEEELNVNELKNLNTILTDSLTEAEELSKKTDKTEEEKVRLKELNETIKNTNKEIAVLEEEIAKSTTTVKEPTEKAISATKEQALSDEERKNSEKIIKNATETINLNRRQKEAIEKKAKGRGLTKDEEDSIGLRESAIVKAEALLKKHKEKLSQTVQTETEKVSEIERKKNAKEIEEIKKKIKTQESYLDSLESKRKTEPKEKEQVKLDEKIENVKKVIVGFEKDIAKREGITKAPEVKKVKSKKDTELPSMKELLAKKADIKKRKIIEGMTTVEQQRAEQQKELDAINSDIKSLNERDAQQREIAKKPPKKVSRKQVAEWNALDAKKKKEVAKKELIEMGIISPSKEDVLSRVDVINSNMSLVTEKRKYTKAEREAGKSLKKKSLKEVNSFLEGIDADTSPEQIENAKKKKKEYINMPLSEWTEKAVSPKEVKQVKKVKKEVKERKLTRKEKEAQAKKETKIAKPKTKPASKESIEFWAKKFSEATNRNERKEVVEAARKKHISVALMETSDFIRNKAEKEAEAQANKRKAKIKKKDAEFRNIRDEKSKRKYLTDLRLSKRKGKVEYLVKAYDEATSKADRTVVGKSAREAEKSGVITKDMLNEFVSRIKSTDERVNLENLVAHEEKRRQRIDKSVESIAKEYKTKKGKIGDIGKDTQQKIDEATSKIHNKYFVNSLEFLLRKEGGIIDRGLSDAYSKLQHYNELKGGVRFGLKNVVKFPDKKLTIQENQEGIIDNSDEIRELMIDNHFVEALPESEDALEFVFSDNPPLNEVFQDDVRSKVDKEIADARDDILENEPSSPQENSIRNAIVGDITRVKEIFPELSVSSLENLADYSIQALDTVYNVLKEEVKKIGNYKNILKTAGFKIKPDFVPYSFIETSEEEIGFHGERDAELDPIKAESDKIQAGIEGKTLLEVAEFIANEAPNKHYQLIAKKVLSKLKELNASGVEHSLKIVHKGDMVGGLKKEDIPREILSARGASRLNKDGSVDVFINGKELTGKVGTSFRTVLHELIHASTQSSILDGSLTIPKDKKNKRLTTDLHKLREHIVTYFNKRAKTPENLTDFEKKIFARNVNAIKTKDEIIAWALTDKDMQDYLDNIPYDSKQSVWSKFVESIRNMLGIPATSNSALSEALRVSERLLDVSISDKTKKTATKGIERQALFSKSKISKQEFEESSKQVLKIFKDKKVEALIKEEVTRVFGENLPFRLNITEKVNGAGAYLRLVQDGLKDILMVNPNSQDVIGAVYHESIHSILTESSGYLTKSDIAIIKNAGKENGVLTQELIKTLQNEDVKNNDTYNQDNVIPEILKSHEESIAYAAQYFLKGKLRLKPTYKRIIEKIIDVFAQIRDTLMQNGIKQPTDLMNRIQQIVSHAYQDEKSLFATQRLFQNVREGSLKRQVFSPENIASNRPLAFASKAKVTEDEFEATMQSLDKRINKAFNENDKETVAELHAEMESMLDEVSSDYFGLNTHATKKEMEEMEKAYKRATSANYSKAKVNITLEDLQNLQEVNTTAHIVTDGGETSFRDHIGKKKKSTTDIVLDNLNRKTVKKIKERFVTDFIDKYNELGNYEKALNNGVLLDAKYSAYKAFRMAASTPDIFLQAMRHGSVEYDENKGITRIKKGSKGLLKTFEDLGEDAKAWAEHRVGVRAKRLKGESKEHNFTNKQIGQMINLKTSKNAAKFEKADREYTQFNNQMLDYAEKAGTLNPATRAQWEENDYIPFYRIFDTPTGAPFRELTGKEANIRDPLQNIMLNVNLLIEGAVKNEAKKRVVKLFGQEGSSVIRKSLSDERATAKKKYQKLLQESFSEEDESKKMEYVKTSMKKVGMTEKGFSLDGISGKHWLSLKNRLSTRLANDEIIGIQLSDNKEISDEDVHNFMKSQGYSEKEISELKKTKEGKAEILRHKKIQLRHWQNSNHSMTVLEDGIPVIYTIKDPDLMTAISALDWKPNDFFQSKGMKAARGAKRLITSMVTITPDFMVANLLRDTIATSVVTKNGFIPVWDSLKGLKKAFNVNDKSLIAMNAGGGGLGSTFHINDPGAAETLITRETKATKFSSNPWGQVQRFAYGYKRLMEASEKAARIPIYENIVEQGKKEGKDLTAEAIYQSRDILDFAASGNSNAAQFLIQTVPFLNARLQGLSRIKRGAWDNPTNFLVKGTLVAAAATLLTALNEDDERYKDLEEWDVDANFHVWIGDTYIKIPKPFEVGAIFATIPERLYRSYSGTDEGKATQEAVMRMLMDTFMINPTPQIVKPVAEVFLTNTSWFTGTPIVPDYMKNVSPSAQFTDRTSITLKVVGDKFGFSPLQMEAFVRGYFANMGMVALAGADALARSIGEFPEEPTKDIDEWFFFKRFLAGEEARRTKYGKQLYDIVHEMNVLTNTMNKYKKEGNTEKFRELMEENRLKLSTKGGVTAAKNKLSSLRNKIKKIHRDKYMSGEMKKKRIDELNRVVLKVQKQAAQRFNRYFKD